jgi:hypothetical protein
MKRAVYLITESAHGNTNNVGTMMQQVQKRTARKLFQEGEMIYLCPCNMHFDSAWQTPIVISKAESLGFTFDQLCNDYEYFNCDSERGRYVRFYVKCK